MNDILLKCLLIGMVFVQLVPIYYSIRIYFLVSGLFFWRMSWIFLIITMLVVIARRSWMVFNFTILKDEQDWLITDLVFTYSLSLCWALFTWRMYKFFKKYLSLADDSIKYILEKKKEEEKK